MRRFWWVVKLIRFSGGQLDLDKVASHPEPVQKLVILESKGFEDLVRFAAKQNEILES
jgi:hypothetical protein